MEGIYRSTRFASGFARVAFETHLPYFTLAGKGEKTVECGICTLHAHREGNRGLLKDHVLNPPVLRLLRHIPGKTEGIFPGPRYALQHVTTVLPFL